MLAHHQTFLSPQHHIRHPFMLPTLLPHPIFLRLHHISPPPSISHCSSSPHPAAIDLDDLLLHRQRLKQELFSSLDESHGGLDSHCMSIIDSLAQLNPYPDITPGTRIYSGVFQGIRSSFKGTGRKGEANKDVGTSGSSITLGRATFNSLKPRDLDITLKQTYNHVAVEDEDSYNLAIEFEVIDPGAGGEEILKGLLTNRAKFTIAGPTRMNVAFLSSTMTIRNPDIGLDRWLKLFKEANPGMDERGSVTVSLPPAKGYLDYLFIDEDLRITRGNRGGVVVVRRMAEPVVHL